MLSDEIVTAPADVLIIPMTADLSFAVQTATALRNAGVRAQLYTEQKKFKAKMSYADKLGFPYVILIGEDEIAAGKVALKDMQSGVQNLVSPVEAASTVSEALEHNRTAAVIKE